ncbi:MAG TPA: hypothetical protein VNP72_00375 [Longimicrobium sp.]|nr:hypothetical protein [Longimicrobium sp.]
MRKLRLDLDELTVESFEPGNRGAGAGTVLGHGEEPTDCSKQPTCGAASRGDETYDMLPRTLYACCV